MPVRKKPPTRASSNAVKADSERSRASNVGVGMSVAWATLAMLTPASVMTDATFAAMICRGVLLSMWPDYTSTGIQASPWACFYFHLDVSTRYRSQVANRNASDFSKRLADVIVGEYKKRRLTQASIASDAGFSPVTLQRMLAGVSEISAEDVVKIAAVVGFDPAEVITEAIEIAGGVEALMPPPPNVSDAPATNDFERKRRQREVAAMTPEQLEGQRHAATRDPELDSDQPSDT